MIRTYTLERHEALHHRPLSIANVTVRMVDLVSTDLGPTYLWFSARSTAERMAVVRAFGRGKIEYGVHASEKEARAFVLSQPSESNGRERWVMLTGFALHSLLSDFIRRIRVRILVPRRTLSDKLTFVYNRPASQGISRKDAEQRLVDDTALHLKSRQKPFRIDDVRMSLLRRGIILKHVSAPSWDRMERSWIRRVREALDKLGRKQMERTRRRGLLATTPERGELAVPRSFLRTLGVPVAEWPACLEAFPHLVKTLTLEEWGLSLYPNPRMRPRFGSDAALRHLSRPYAPGGLRKRSTHNPDSARGKR